MSPLHSRPEHPFSLRPSRAAGALVQTRVIGECPNSERQFPQMNAHGGCGKLTSLKMPKQAMKLAPFTWPIAEPCYITNSPMSPLRYSEGPKDYVVRQGSTARLSRI